MSSGEQDPPGGNRRVRFESRDVRDGPARLPARVETTRQSMIDRVATVAHVAVLPEDRRARVLDQVADLIPRTGPLSVPYRVDCYVTRPV